MKNQYMSEEMCEKALKRFGKERQMWQLIEEFSELEKEIAKEVNGRREDLKDLTEEAADVLIMMDQLLYIYNIHDEVKAQAEYKVNRLRKYLESTEK